MSQSSRQRFGGAIFTAAFAIGILPGCGPSAQENFANEMKANRTAADLARAVQAKAEQSGEYDDNVNDYLKDFGGTMPMNPCTGPLTPGYTIMKVTDKDPSAVVMALTGSKCGIWGPLAYSLTLNRYAGSKSTPARGVFLK